MNQSFYTAAVGAQQQQCRMNVQGNNIANVNNYGFKAERSAFSALMNYAIPGAEEELRVGVGALVNQTSTNYAAGPCASTGNPLDYAIQGDGFFGLVDPATGEVSFTRTGAFILSEFQVFTGEMDGTGTPEMETVYRLADAEGRFVLSREGEVIDVTDGAAEQPIGVFDFINYDGMLHVGDNRFSQIEKNGQLRFGTGTVRQGMLELSNVDLAEELTKVIESQRAYGMALKMMQTSDEIESTINGLRS